MEKPTGGMTDAVARAAIGGGDLAAELSFLLKRAGHEVPTDRVPGIVAGYGDLKVMLALVRQPRSAANEPANVYCLDTITRGR